LPPLFRFVCFFIAAAAPAAVYEVGSSRIEATVTNGKLSEHLLVKQGASWLEVASDAGAVSVRGPGGAVLPSTVENVSVGPDGLVEDFKGDGFRVRRTVRQFGQGPWFWVTTRLTPESPIQLHAFFDTLHASFRPEWSFSPSVGGFNPDGKYKAPLILVQSGYRAIGIVPDVLRLDAASLRRCNHTIDLDVPAGPLLSVGFIPSIKAYHTVFKENLDRVWTAEGPVDNTYYLYLSGNSAAGEAFREAVRFHWAQFGSAALPLAADEQAGTDAKYIQCRLWDEWRNTVWERESRDSWLTVPLPGTTPPGMLGGAVAMTRAHAPKRSVYLGAWFNSLRTSYGMALYARRVHDDSLMQLAQQTLALALHAPGHDGMFKCFGVPEDSPGKVFWGAGDGAVDSVSSGYLGFDMSWTGYWLLKWREAKLPGSDDVLPRCRRLADFLISRQEPDGMLPTRFDESGATQKSLARTVPAETGAVVRFLLKLYQADANGLYLEAAKRGLSFLDKDVAPLRKWYDYETFWSCSPRLVAFDERSAQWPANNLALIHTVAAYLEAAQITHDNRYQAKGEVLLDYLLLYQQSWTNPVLENLTSKVMLLGGFTTQNSDGEWSDARQSLAGEVLMDYYRATGKAEYLERGVEALRSQFPISPSENWAHEAYGKKAGISSFHWGTGSGMAGIEMEEDYLRDGVCDVAAARCVGVNGLNVTASAIKGDRIELQVNSPFHWERRPVFAFHQAPVGTTYRLFVNGSEVGRFSREALETGVPIPIPS
jgi:hypothetical protein